MHTQKEWLDYINRLQERERQKITSGGLSNWAVAVALLGLAYWLYPDLIGIQQHWSVVLIGYALFTNVSISVFDIFNFYIRREKVHSFYNSKKQNADHKGVIILQVFDITVILLNLIINIILLILSNVKGYTLLEVYFFVYCLRYLCDAFVFISIKIKLWKSEKLFTQAPSKKWLYAFKFGLLFSLLFNVYLILQLAWTIDFSQLLWKQIFDGFAIGIIILLAQFMFTIFIKRMKIGWLERLEKEIILKSLNEKQIIARLNNEYYSCSHIDDYFS